MAADGITGDTTTQGRLALGQPLTGSLDQAGERAWYQVTLTAGQSYWFSMAGGTTGHGTLRDPLLYLYDNNGQLITQNDDSGGLIDSRVTYTATRTGAYFVAAGAYNDAQRGSFTLEAAAYGDDYSARAPGVLQVGGSLGGNLEVLADIDWIRVDLRAGQRYLITVEGVDTGQGTLKDPYLYVYDSDGKSLAQADDGGVRRNSLLNFTPENSGTFYLAVSAFQQASSGTYSLSLSQAADAKAGGEGDTGKSISLGGSQSGEIVVRGGQDRYEVELTAGQTYCFDLMGRASGQGTLDDPYLYLHDDAGRRVAHDDDGGSGLDSRLVFTPWQSGKYYLGAGAFNNAGTGAYVLAANKIPGAGLDQTSAQGALSAFGARAGQLANPGQRDWLPLALEAANSYLITLEPSGGQDGLARPALGLYDFRGTPMLSAGPGSAESGASLSFTPSEGGLYYIDCRAGGNGDGGRYLLSVVGRQVEQFNQEPARGDWSVINPLEAGRVLAANPLFSPPAQPPHALSRMAPGNEASPAQAAGGPAGVQATLASQGPC